MKISAIAAVVACLSAACSGGAASGDGHVDDVHSGHGHEHAEGETNEVEVTAAQMKAAGITLGVMEQRELGSSLHAAGVLAVDPSGRAEIAPMESGQVTKINVVEGMNVSRGAVVAEVSSAAIIELQASYREAVDQETLARKEYNRQKALNDNGAGIQRNLEQAQSMLAVAEIRAKSLADRIRQAGAEPSVSGAIKAEMAVKSHVAGTVTKIYASTGSYADVQTPIMAVVNPAAVYASLKVFEKDLPQVKVGQSVDMRLTNMPEVEVEGVVTEVGRAIDQQTRAVDVRVRITACNGAELMPGMAVSASLNLGTEMLDALPDAAIATIGTHKYIFVLEHQNGDDYHFDRVEVAVGVGDMGYTSVVPQRKLEADAKIVTSGAFYLGSMTADHGEHSH